MLPPQQGDIQSSLLAAQFSALRDGISRVIVSEIMPLRALIECSAKEIDVRLLKLEDRLQTALEPHSSQKAHDVVVQDTNHTHVVSIDTDSKQFAGIGIVLRSIQIF